MTENRPKPGLPVPGLALVERMGYPGLLYPPAQSIFPGVRSYLNYPYALVPGYRFLRLDLHVPEGATRPLPVVIYASGGAWMLVAKSHAPWKALLSEGFAVAAIEYRLSGEARFPVPVHDVKAAIRWVRAQAAAYGLDASRIAGWGSSAGGYLMSIAGATPGIPEFEGTVGENLDQSSALAAVIAHYAPSDLATMGEDTNGVPGVMELLGTETAPESRLLGFVPGTRPQEAARANVATYVSAATVPMLLMHGDGDTRLGVNQSHRLYDALKKVGADVAFHVVPGANHGSPEFESPETIALILALLRRVLAYPQ